MATIMVAVIKANGRVFFGFLISPVLIRTDSNPPNANIKSRTEVEKEENSGGLCEIRSSGWILNMPIIIKAINGISFAIVSILFTRVESFTPIWLMNVRLAVINRIQAARTNGLLNNGEKNER